MQNKRACSLFNTVRMRLRAVALAAVAAVILTGCAGLPDTIEPVTGFELERYLGKWYEIARLDHRFERGLEQVTATYSRNEDGTVNVANRGYETEEARWRDAVGNARFADSPQVGHLEVSFFGPFYGPYVIFELDDDYQWAYVTSSENALWLLARTPQVDQARIDAFVESAAAAGYATDELIFVRQAMPESPTEKSAQ